MKGDRKMEGDKTRAEILKDIATLKDLTESDFKEMFSDDKVFKGITHAEIFGKNLDNCLRRKNIERKTLADKLGTSQATIARYISGKIEPPLGKLFEIAKFLKVSVTELIGDTEYNLVTRSTEEIIFEERFKRALKLVKAAGFDVESQNDKFILSIPLIRHVEENGERTISIENQTYKIKNKFDFITIFETSEEQAIRQHRPFKATLKDKLRAAV